MTNNLVYAISIKERIDHLNNNGYSSDVTDNVSKWLERKSLWAEELFVFSLQQQQKQLQCFEGETPNDRFIYSMKRRFGASKTAYRFFEDYPVLARLLAERISFHVANYTAFVTALEGSRKELKKVFGIDGK
ncbi:hypothetical protein NRIC_33990 [Enterococcus florum]|uniref:Uncharacterized protein n=2 Tax=Enterococcus florum TaxID=2480627 RepID=A0A4P5PGR7_9ENTE|nr:hypothetical protein NRIC_33990 [Enterococcus florum]